MTTPRGPIRRGVDTSIRQSEQVDAKLDAGAIEVARALADQIDEAVELFEGTDRTKALYLTPHLMNVLRELYATPKARLEAGLSDSDSDDESSLGVLRGILGGQSA